MAAWYAQVIFIIHAERMTGTEYLAKYPKTSSFLLKMGTCGKNIKRTPSVMLGETTNSPRMFPKTQQWARRAEKKWFIKNVWIGLTISSWIHEFQKDWTVLKDRQNAK